MTKRPVASLSQWVLASLSAFVSVAAVFGGVGLIRDGMGMPRSGWTDCPSTHGSSPAWRSC